MTTYAILKSDVADWLLRDDLVNVIPSFVRLCEANIRRDVRVRAQEVAADVTITNGAGTLPDGFIEARRITLDSASDYALTFMVPQVMYASRLYAETGTATAYAIEGDSLVLRPKGSSTAKVGYIKAFDALADESDTNWLMANAYDIYLYGTLSAASPYIKEDARIQLWRSLYQEAVQKINRADNYARISGAALKAVGVSGP